MATRLSKPTEPASRMDQKAWIRGALDILADQGIDGVRVELLAKHLGVTKGSFYWHFKDRHALLDEMLQGWRRMATLAIIERLEQSDRTPQERLNALIKLPFSDQKSKHGADVELAIRLWGRRDEKARKALEEVDQLRLRYFTQLFEAVGVESEDALARAMLAYSFIRIAPSLPDGRAARMLDTVQGILVKP